MIKIASPFNEFKSVCYFPLFVLLVVSISDTANAQTITVTMCRDVIDVPSAATIDDLPGPDGKVSMNEALRASDNTPGIQTIAFAIPESEWWLPTIFEGQVLLQSTFGWSAQETVIIDGTTQTAFTGDTFPDGHEMSLDGLGLSLNGDNSEIFGFHGCNVGLGGNNSVIHNNTGKMDISVGPFNSGNIIRDNDADTIELTYSDNNVVIRNVAERVRITGQGNFGPPASGNIIGGPDLADRNYITGWGNVGEHGSVAGDTVELYYTDNTLIQNNYIGTTPDGMSIGNHASTVGVGVYNSNHNLTVRDNLIAIQAHWGGGSTGEARGAPVYLNLYEGGSNIRILNNTLGLNALGEPVLGGEVGVLVNRYAFEYGAIDIQIGGPNPGEANVIAGHESAGVLMYNGPGIVPNGSIRLSGNSIYGNGEIGIDLMPNTWDFGPTPNDPLDADVIGANGLQNFPELLAATNRGDTIIVMGQLNSLPLSEYSLEFFASPECDPSGFGQGQAFLGAMSISTDEEGNAEFEVSLPASIEQGWFLTSTATLEPVGATSEFSACIDIFPSSPEPTLPLDFEIIGGEVQSGGLAELMVSDNQYLVLQNSARRRGLKTAISVNSTATTDTPSTLSFRLECSVKGFEETSIIQSIELFNYITGRYESVDDRHPTCQDSVATIAPDGDPTRFVESETGAMQARVSYRRLHNGTLTVSGRRFQARIDQISWIVTP